MSTGPTATRASPRVILYMDAPGIRPALFGHAERLAGAGYTAILPDLYYPFDPAERPNAERMAAGDAEEFARMRKLVAQIHDDDVIEDTRLLLEAVPDGGDGPWACVGFCMGGRFGMRAAEAFGSDVAAASLLHPTNLVTDEPDSPHLGVDRVEAALYLGFGENDSVTPLVDDPAAPRAARAGRRSEPDRDPGRRRARLHDAGEGGLRRGGRRAGVGRDAHAAARAAVKPSRFEYLAPETCEEALGALAEHGDDAAVLAGGQSLIPMMNLRIAAPGVLIDVMRTPDLRGIRCENGRTEIGAGVRMAEAEQDSTVPLLQRALRHVGHPAIRNAGTVCGSVAHADPAAELPAVLLALDGEVVLRSVRGERIVAADEFFRSYYMTAREPDELVVAVRIPADTPRVAFHEATPRLGGSTGELPLDVHAGPEYRRRLVSALTRRALTELAS